MGTRGLLVHTVKSKGLRKGTYNHWDSYPGGLGKDLAEFINSLTEEQIEKMRENLARVQWIKPVPQGAARDMDSDYPGPSQELQDRYVAAGFAGPRGDIPPIPLRNCWEDLLRNVQGAKTLPYILDGTLEHLTDDTPFEKDTVFCEWSYEVLWEERIVRVKDSWAKSWEATFAELSPAWMDQIEH